MMLARTFTFAASTVLFTRFCVQKFSVEPVHRMRISIQVRNDVAWDLHAFEILVAACLFSRDTRSWVVD